MADVFISYKREDRPRVKPLVEALTAQGLSVWWDVSIEGGSVWRRQIEAALEAARCVIVVWSEASIGPAGEFVQDEASHAKARDVYLPVTIDHVRAPLGFGQVQPVPLWRWNGRIDDAPFVNLLAAVRAKLAGPGKPVVDQAPPVATSPPGRTRWRPGRWSWIAMAAIVLALAGAAAVRWWPQPAAGPPVVRLIALTALGPDVPASLPAALTDDVRAAFGTDNVVTLRDRDPDFVLSGLVRRVDDKLRLTMRLDDGGDGAMLWSSVREWKAVEQVSPRLNAVSITRVLRCGLLDGADLSAHALALYLQYCEARWSVPSQHDRSAAIARRLVQEAPRFARGWSSLAFTTRAMSDLDPTRADAATLRAEARSAAARALSLDPRDAQAYEVQAYLLPETAYAARQNLLRRASESRLTACGCEVVGYGGSLIVVGRVREAVLQFERAHQREPLGVHANQLSVGYALLGDVDRSDQAFATLSGVYADLPGFSQLEMFHAALAGRWSEAARLAAKGTRPALRDALIFAFEALASRDQTRIAAARPAVAKAAAAMPDIPFFSLLLAALGDRPGALTVMERTIDRDLNQLYYPAARTLRHEPRYLRLLERRGLIKHWRETHTRPDMCAAPDPPAFCKTL